jgi:predicted small secreted protein
LSALFLTACNTIEGVGRDIKAGGKNLEESACSKIDLIVLDLSKIQNCGTFLRHLNMHKTNKVTTTKVKRERVARKIGLPSPGTYVPVFISVIRNIQ